MVLLESQELKRKQVRDPFRRDLRAIALQLGISEDNIWDALREKLFCSSIFGSRLRRVGEYRAEVNCRENMDYYFATAGISGSEHTFALLDVTMRMIRTDPRVTPWIIIIDSSLFLGLDDGNKRRVFKTLAEFEDPAVQTIVCVNAEKDALKLTAEDGDRWIGSSTHGGLTVHSFL